MQRQTTQRGAIRDVFLESDGPLGPQAGARPQAANEPSGAATRAAAPAVALSTIVLPREAVAQPAAAAPRGRSGLLALLPLACAIHCMATPLLVAVVPGLGLGPTLEWVLLTGSVGVAILALRRGARFYRRRLVSAVACAGAAVWALSLLGVFEPLPETIASPVGGLVLAAALFWNGRLSHRHACSDCDCPMH